MKQALPLLILMLVGCSSLTAQQNALVIGSVSKTTIETVDRELWDPFVRDRTDACDPESNPEVKTKRDFDACLGPAVHDDKVVELLEVYVVAADKLFVVLKNPSATVDQIKQARQQALDAAVAVLEAMGPIGKKHLEDLRAIAKGK